MVYINIFYTFLNIYFAVLAQVAAMSEEEQRRLFEARQIQNEADREREELALLEARRLMEKVK